MSVVLDTQSLRCSRHKILHTPALLLFMIQEPFVLFCLSVVAYFLCKNLLLTYWFIIRDEMDWLVACHSPFVVQKGRQSVGRLSSNLA